MRFAAAGGASQWARAGALVVMVSLSGCAMLGLGESKTASNTNASTNAADPNAGPPAVQVDIQAPPELKTLLEKNLDVTRLGGMVRGDAVSETEWLRLMDAAPLQVQELLQTEGFFSPVVKVTRGPPTADAAGVAPQRLRIDVTPGVRTVVGRVTIEFEGDLQRHADAGDANAAKLVAELRRAWALPTGTAFRNTAWRDAKVALLARLRAAGYAIANWGGTGAEVDPPTQQARIFLVADSGPQFLVGDIDIEGLEVQEAVTVRNLAAFKPGTPLTETLLLDYQDRLQKSGLFDSVTVTHDTDPAHAASAHVQVHVHEQTLQVYTFGVGYSANSGPRTTIEHVHRRLFGQPLRSRTYVELARLKRTLSFELSTHPFEGLNRNIAGVTIERLQTSTDTVLSERIRAGRARDTVQAERLIFAEVERSVRSTALLRNETFAVSGNVHLTLRDLDNVVLPTSGYTLALQGGLGRSRGTDAPQDFYARAYGRLTSYVPLGSAWYGQARIELGQVFRKGPMAVPDSQLFRAGGDDSVRGYAFRDLGPIVDGAVSGGASLFTSSVELARPISASMPSLWGAVFFDVGRAATSFRDLKPATGYGLGVRWRSPVGPLRADWAWAPELHRGRLHFSIGIAL